MKQAKTNAIMRPVAVGIVALSIAGAGIAFSMELALLGAAIFMAGALLAGALWWSSALTCPACGSALEVEGARGLFVPPATVSCAKCRVTGHPKSTLPKAMQDDRPPTNNERKHAKRRAAVKRRAEEKAGVDGDDV